MTAPRRKREIPFWLLAIILLGLFVAWLIASDGDYAVIFAALRQGVFVTLWVSVVAFALASVLGLLVALARTSRYRLAREVATFYVEIVRDGVASGELPGTLLRAGKDTFSVNTR